MDIPRLIKVAEGCNHALWPLDRGYYADALRLLDLTLSRHSVSPMIDATRSLVYYNMASQILDSTSKRQEHLVKALESSRQAAALAPTTTSCALFHALVLLRLGQHEAALQECERGLSIKRPEEPGCLRRIPEEREMTIRSRLRLIKERSNLKIIVLDHGKQRDKWKRLLEDKSLLEVKNELETFHQMKKMIVAAGSEDFLKEKKVIMKEQRKIIQRVRPYWTGTMHVESKRALLKVEIQELKAHFTKIYKEDFLQEAIDFAKEAKNWRVWKCCRCDHGFPTDQSILLHIRDEHLGIFSYEFKSVFPTRAAETVFNWVGDGVWKPVESSWPANLVEADSNILLHQENWPLCDDINREGLIEEIRAKLLLFKRSDCFASGHFEKLRSLIKDLLRNHISEQEKIDQMFDVNDFLSICFLEIPELKRVLELFEDMARACALPCIAETLPEGQDFYCDVRDRVIFNTEFSDILLDERLLLAETTDLEDDANAVGDSSTCLTDLDPNDDAFLYRLWKRDLPIPERLQTWESIREAGRSRGLELYKIFEAEFDRLRKLFEMKLLFLRYQKAFQEIEKMYMEVRNRRLLGFPESYLDILVNWWKYMEADGGAVEDIRSFKLDVIWSILEVTQEDTEIETEIQRQRQLLDQRLLLLDVLILATHTAFQHTSKSLVKLCAYDYRFIVVPVLRSFVQKRLVDLVEESEHLRPAKSLKISGSEEEHHAPGKKTSSSEEADSPGSS